MPVVPPARAAGRRHHPLRTARLPAAALATLSLTACAPVIGVDAAPDAADPVCADVVLTVPDTVGGGLPKVRTDSQATAAWGEPGAAVTLRCGVTPPGASADCQRVESADGTVVDWIVTTDGEGTWSFVTYGREPAVEVLVPPAVAEADAAAPVVDLAEAVSVVPATKECR